MDTSVFHNSDVDNGNMRLVKKSGITLDRETKEFYEIELSVCDSDDTTCRNEKTCRQTVFIRVTDVNDNEQSDGGSSNILLFNTEGLLIVLMGIIQYSDKIMIYSYSYRLDE